MKIAHIVACLSLIVFGQQQLILAKDVKDLGKKVSGTYLGVGTDSAHILQIHEDGTLTVNFSIQFSGGALGRGFSETYGSWEKTGKHELTATAVDLTFQIDNGEFFGVAPAKYVLTFNDEFTTAILTCEGAIFPVGVNPFDPDAEPIPDSEFTCGVGTQLHKISPNSSFQQPTMDNDGP